MADNDDTGTRKTSVTGEAAKKQANVAEVIEGAEVLEKQAAVSPPPGSVSEPAKVMRIGSMIRQLLEEVRTTVLDEPGRRRLREIYDSSIVELSTALSPDLRDELVTLGLPFGEDSLPSEAELRIAQAQLVGWLEGLFHGIQATLFAQQMEAKQQLEQMQHSSNRMLGSGGAPQQQPPPSGVYL